MKMKNRKATTCFLILLALCLLQSGVSRGQTRAGANGLSRTDQWFKLAPNIDDFSVEMPGLTNYIVRVQPNNYIYQREQILYTLTSYKERNREGSPSVEERLAQKGEGLSKTMVEYFVRKGKTIKMPKPRQLDLKGAQGLEYVLSDGEELYALRVYVTQKRSYTLRAIVPVAEQPSVDRFMNSFTLERSGPLQVIELPPSMDAKTSAGGPS